jgi:opacity protein-like surface antigen
MTSRTVLLLAVLVFSAALCASAADITGKWTATIDTPVGQMNYTYDFKVEGSKLTGAAKSNMSESAIENGKAEGDNVTFVENMKVQDMVLKVEYTGKIVSADEIKFTRKVGDFGSEEFVAKRSK